MYYAYTLSYTIFLHNTGTCKQRKGASMVYWIPHLQKMQELCFLSKYKRPKNNVNDKILHLKHSWNTFSEFKKLFLGYRQGPFPLIKPCDWSRYKSMKITYPWSWLSQIEDMATAINAPILWWIILYVCLYVCRMFWVLSFHF